MGFIEASKTGSKGGGDGVPVGALMTFSGSQLPGGYEPAETEEQISIQQLNDNLTNLSNRLDNLKFKEVKFNAPSTSGTIGYNSLETLIGETISFSHVLSVRVFNKGNNKWYSIASVSDGYADYVIENNSLGVRLTANGVSVYGNSTIRALIGYYSDN